MGERETGGASERLFHNEATVGILIRYVLERSNDDDEDSRKDDESEMMKKGKKKGETRRERRKDKGR